MQKVIFTENMESKELFSTLFGGGIKKKVCSVMNINRNEPRKGEDNKVKVRVNFEVDIPIDDVTDEQIEEWLRFEYHDNGSISGKNPLVDYEPEAIF